MTTTTAKPATTDRKELAAALQASLVEQVALLRDSEQWRRFLDAARTLHRYSVNNLALILAQRPDATRVAGYNAWRHLGRQVRKGEVGIRIFGIAVRPNSATACDDADDDATAIRKRVYYPIVTVFDIAQTEPIDPESYIDPFTVAHHLTGADDADIYGRVALFLQRRGWSVQRAPIDGGVNGYTTLDGSRLVVVRDDLAPAQAAKTALHEAAHVLLHAEDTDADALKHRGIGEVEAESVAYVVAGLLGLDTSTYSIGYVASWADADVALIRSTATRVLDAVNTLVDALVEGMDDDITH